MKSGEKHRDPTYPLEADAKAQLASMALAAGKKILAKEHWRESHLNLHKNPRTIYGSEENNYSASPRNPKHD